GNCPVLSDGYIGQSFSVKALNPNYTAVAYQHSILPAKNATQSECSSQSHINVSGCHIKGDLNWYQWMRNCAKTQQLHGYQSRQQLPICQQSAAISNCNKLSRPPTYAKCPLQCNRNLDIGRSKGTVE
ncbi:hypothetical protein Tco_1267228, partial [Tanacetum coccineum]